MRLRGLLFPSKGPHSFLTGLLAVTSTVRLGHLPIGAAASTGSIRRELAPPVETGGNRSDFQVNVGGISVRNWSCDPTARLQRCLAVANGIGPRHAKTNAGGKLRQTVLR